MCDGVRAAMALDKFSRGEVGDGRMYMFPPTLSFRVMAQWSANIGVAVGD